MSAAFDTVLVANRGEIARRIIRGARSLGIRTVAVFSDADRAAPHVREADVAVRLGPAPARDSYLDVARLLAAARSSGAGAIHPGYGFLSENADFAREVESAGLVFVGPTPDQLAAFGSKHTARSLAAAAGVPMLPGTGLLASAAEAVAAAESIGLPVMVKATGGGGGIGMAACATAAEVADSFSRVARLAAANFSAAGVFVERLVRPARHVEVQVFGDGTGRVAVLGDRDCSLQRRNQKVLEEAPAPGLGDALRRRLHESSRALAASVRYRSAGTVEFVYDPLREQASFLEVNARLQVEHPVTEQVFGVDLVGWMLRLARDGAHALDAEAFTVDARPTGHAVEARVYAEDPGRDSSPSPGLVTRAVFPGDGAPAMTGVRVDSWIETGLEVSPNYDPLLGKVIASAPDRAGALDLLGHALAASRVDGVATNLGLLRAVTAREDVRAVAHHTTTLDDVADPTPRIDVLVPGLLTTVQDWPGRLGYWQVGVPPSGPMDEVSMREANACVGNPGGAPALECTASGPTLQFSVDTVICLAGATTPADLDGTPVPFWEPVTVPAGGTLTIGTAAGPGLRTYLAVRGGFDVPDHLGSASTFTLGGFGGHGGRALLPGDVLRAGPFSGSGSASPGRPTPVERRPLMTDTWQLGVTEGPHAAPEFFTRADIETLYRAEYTVHFNSARTGIRLTGPRPQWARSDGGDAGLHPSNIHDTPYAVGALDFTGDTPIILGPDGPSLGGFVCPAVVASGEVWKLGQLRPGDTVRFVPVREAAAAGLRERRATPTLTSAGSGGGDGDDGVIGRIEAAPARGTAERDLGRPAVTYRRAGDDNILVEYGEQVLDLGLRMRVHALMTALEEASPTGVLDLTPGIRSLQVHTDPTVRRASSLLGLLREVESDLPPTEDLTVPSRTVHLPLCWDDPSTRLAIERYERGVRDDAPWCPWNIEFIRRINGLETVADVHRTVFDASYLVLGLGDVYLGAPVATPLDPRHRLVTTKYNPARTWTPENAVGIGGAYLCVYGMEGPGGYQLIGRTVPVWSRFRSGERRSSRGSLFREHPWALRFFDRIEWFPVEAEHLVELRAEVDAGRGDLATEDGEFSVAAHQRFLDANAVSIADFRAGQNAAFTAEKQLWRESGEFDVRAEPAAASASAAVEVPTGATAVTAPFVSSVWQVDVAPGARVARGDRLLSLEAMKMETMVTAPVGGLVLGVHTGIGEQVVPGQTLVTIGAGDP